jgi:hypothetical protein
MSGMITIRLDTNEWRALIEAAKYFAKAYKKIGNRSYANWVLAIAAKVELQRIGSDSSSASKPKRAAKR